LRGAGCTRSQGYYFWRPLDVASVEVLLEEVPQPVLPLEPALVVLVVDDDAAVRRSSGRILAQAGYEIVEAGTGEEAITAVSTQRIDAVVLDVELPDSSGFEICSRIKERHHDLPVLHLSGAAVTLDDRVRGLELGADGYLIKPAAPSELVATLGSLLRNSRWRGQSSSANIRAAELRAADTSR
jgi:DNA-binding response OmpR family regulator